MSNLHLTGTLQDLIEQRILHGTSYRGIQTWKNPADAWVYQEIIHATRPGVIVEVGNHKGGALLYLADLCGLADQGLVVGVDINHSGIDAQAVLHPRIRLVGGDAIEAFPAVAKIVAGRSCLVIEDSAHTLDHTLAVLRTYSDLVKPGGYLICEDGVMPPVAAAIARFLQEDGRFSADRTLEWPITWNPGGYLLRA